MAISMAMASVMDGRTTGGFSLPHPITFHLHCEQSKLHNVIYKLHYEFQCLWTEMLGEFGNRAGEILPTVRLVYRLPTFCHEYKIYGNIILESVLVAYSWGVEN